MNYILHIISSLSPLIFFFGGILFSLVTRNNFGYYFTTYLTIFGDLFNRLLKIIFTNIFSESEWIKRPDPDAPCNFFLNNPTHQSGGFPSGHAQTISLGTTLGLSYLWHFSTEIITKKIIITILLCLFLLYVCWSRLSLGCHNIYQIIGGLIIGLIFGLYGYYLFVNFTNLDNLMNKGS